MKKFALLLAVLAATACGHPSQGVIYNKTYVPQSQYVTMVCTMYGKNGVCQIWMPIQNTTPECWRLDIKDGGETWEVCVNKYRWDNAEIGATWKEEG